MNFESILAHHLVDHKTSHKVIATVAGLPVDMGLSPLIRTMWIACGIAIVALTFAARSESSLARVMRSMFEPLALFVRDEILEPIFGHHAGHYLPYFLTLFFFLLTCNLLGLVPHMPLRFEDAQLGAHGRIAALARQRFHQLTGGGPAQLIEDVHDLPLAPRQLGVQGLGHRYFSNEMLEQARKKSTEVTFLPGHFLNFILPEKVDAALCLDFSVNYILRPDEFREFFKRVHHHLNSGGIFIYDVKPTEAFLKKEKHFKVVAKI